MPEDPKPDDEQERKPTDPGERLDVNRLIAEHGDAKAAAAYLARKVDEVERDNATLRSKLREAKLPDGARVLTAEEGATYDALLALGTPDELKAKLTEAEEAQGRLAEVERERLFALVAEAAGVDLAALKSARGSEALSYEIEGEGDERKVFVKDPAADDAAERVEFEKHVDEHWAALKPALYGTGATPEAKPSVPGRPFVVQKPGGRPPAPEKPDAAKVAAEKRRDPAYAAMV